MDVKEHAGDPIFYLCGPMTGRPGYNYETFNRVAAHLRSEGFIILNPTETFGGNIGLTYDQYIRKNISDMLNVHGLIALEGYLFSPGARLEMGMAIGLGLPVYFANETEHGVDLVPFPEYNTKTPHESLRHFFKI